jgi:multicomponent Na+:H+ antiporter subunit D
MVCAIGIGTEMALNGAVAHAFSHILYKALLFMSTGSVIYITGKKLLSDLSGSDLYKKMPVTLILYTIGAFSISGVPLLNGFISKSMTIYAAAMEKQGIIQLMLTFASVGTFLSVAMKLCYFAWFGEKRQDRIVAATEAKEPPFNMLLGMGIAALLCVFMGIYPSVLYNILPYDVAYHPYKAAKVVGTLSLLLWTAFGFMLLRKKLTPVPKISLDADWFYRKGALAFMWFINNPLSSFLEKIRRTAFDIVPTSLIWFSRNPLAAIKITLDRILFYFSSTDRKTEIAEKIKKEADIYPGDIITHWPIGWTVLWVTMFLLIYLMTYYLI